ncbi:MAG: hypothetical protein PHU40_08495 [Sulfurimonas sp.]|nr:hypothetical protein [Sulfurimonas sp.]
MKIKLPLLVLVFLTITLYADKNWIAIEPLNMNEPSKKIPQKDLNATQKESINTMLNKVAIMRGLLEGTSKDEDKEDEKNWYPLEAAGNK